MNSYNRPASTILREVREAIRNPLTSIGAYPVYTVLRDGGLLCAQCARDNYRHISEHTRHPEWSDDWAVVGAEVYWEGPEIDCTQCGHPLDSAYGPTDEEDQS